MATMGNTPLNHISPLPSGEGLGKRLSPLPSRDGFGKRLSGLRIALFGGSFDPFTIGHDDIVRRALRLFDKLYVVVTVNPEKHYMFSTEERIAAIRKLYADESRVVVDVNNGMTADFAKKVGAKFQVRGVRTSQDFEYEKVEAEYNKRLGGIETVLLYSPPELAAVSSTAYRQLVYFHKETEAQWMLPKGNL